MKKTHIVITSIVTMGILVSLCFYVFTKGHQYNLSQDEYVPHEIIEDFVDQISDYKNEENSKGFISYSVLGIEQKDNGNLIYYIVAGGLEYYIDYKGDLRDDGGFGSWPMKLEIKKIGSGYKLIDSRQAEDFDDGESTRKAFPAYILKRLQKGDFIYQYGNDQSTLERAEKYFGIKVFTGKQFVCDFCDKKWYWSGEYFIDDKAREQQIVSVYSSGINKTKGADNIIFLSSGIFKEQSNDTEQTGEWIFGNNKDTILVKQERIISRNIFLEHSEDQLKFYSELILTN